MIERNRLERDIIDISVLLKPGSVTWPGDPAYYREAIASISNGDSCSVSQIFMGSHSGTHIDAPSHCFEDAASTDQLTLETLVGEALVADLACPESANVKSTDMGITARDLKQIDLTGTTRLLLKTPNSNLYTQDSFTDRYAYLTLDAAKYLVESGIKLIGIDYLSIDPPECNDAHLILLEAGVVILETIDLSGVESGRYELLCLPLKIQGSDGAPVRAVLRPLTQGI
jgi:arylformamidase